MLDQSLPDEDQPTFREQLYWTALGVGIVYCIYDSTFLQLPWWIASQPEGLQLPSRMSVVATGALFCTVPSALLWRHLAPDGFRRGIVPALIAGQAAAGLLLASGLWTLSSMFIYAAVFLSYSVGGLAAFATVPWLMTSGYKPALVSSLYLGGSAASLAASVLATVQAPASASPRFSPQVFFAIISLPVLLLSPVAYVAIIRGKIGQSERSAGPQPSPPEAGRTLQDSDEESGPPKVTFGRESVQEQEQLLQGAAAATPGDGGSASDGDLDVAKKGGGGGGGAGQQGACSEIMDGLRDWGPRALPIVLLFSVIQACTWLILRSVIGYASAHTVPGHALCQPHCAAGCEDIFSESACGLQSTCRWVAAAVVDGQAAAGGGGGDGGAVAASVCAEDRGEGWIQWAVALAQWSYTAGIGLTILCPWLNMAFTTLVWAAAFAVVIAMATLTDGTFEFAGAGQLLVGAACVVRALDGFLEVMIFRYIAAQYPKERAQVTIFMGVVEKVTGFIFISAISAMVESGWFVA